MLAPPSYTQRTREARLGFDAVRLAFASPRLWSLPRGDGSPVVVVPGMGATDASLLPMRGFLARLGHDVRASGLGRVGGDVRALSLRLGELCARIVDETGARPSVIGWSIGGVLGRELARMRPDLVTRVITFGTPVEGGPSYTALSSLFSEEQLAFVRRLIEERHQMPIRVPITAIWSPNDGIVAPAACIDRRSPDVEHVKVSGTHLGMSIDPDVWSTIARRLARPN